MGISYTLAIFQANDESFANKKGVPFVHGKDLTKQKNKQYSGERVFSCDFTLIIHLRSMLGDALKLHMVLQNSTILQTESGHIWL